MGFEKPGETKFRIPVSDTQAYRQFGNAVVVPAVQSVANLMEPHIAEALERAGRPLPSLQQRRLLLPEPGFAA